MTAATPTTVMVKNDGLGLSYGTSRRMVTIYVECSPTIAYTTNLATYVPNLAQITGLNFNGSSTALISTVACMATWSTTTVTWGTGGAQFAEFRGYYT